MNSARYKDPVIEFYKRDVDRPLLRENLRLSHQERLENCSQPCGWWRNSKGQPGVNPGLPDNSAC
jgi:hypothetical protein